LGRYEIRYENTLEDAMKTKRQLASRIMPGILNLEVESTEKGDYMIKGYYPCVMLLWVGHKFYKTPGEYMSEAGRMGISRRVKSIPRNFELGKTWVWLAHIEAVRAEDGTYEPAVFHAFQPQRMEYVVAEDDTEEKLNRLERQGFTLVNVVRLGEQTDIEEEVE